MSSFWANEYELKIFILTVASGTLCIFSFPQLVIGVTKVCRMNKLPLPPPKAIFYACLFSLLSAYFTMVAICLLSISVNFIEPLFGDDFLNDSEYDDWEDSSTTFEDVPRPNIDNNRRILLAYAKGGKQHDFLGESDEQRDNLRAPEMVLIGISIVELLFIISKASINLLFLCRLYYSFKNTLFHYSFKSLLILFVLIFIELIIYITFSEIALVHFFEDYNFAKINKIFLCSYFVIDMLLRLIFILLFERGLYRLATARSFKSNLKLFGFGGASIDQIELSFNPSTYTTATATQSGTNTGTNTPGEGSSTTTTIECDVAMPLKDQVNNNKKLVPSMANSTASNTMNTNISNAASNNNHFLHPLSYQQTDRDHHLRLALAEQAIPEEDIECMDMEDASFHYLDDEYHKEDNDTLRSVTAMTTMNAEPERNPNLYNGDSSVINQPDGDRHDRDDHDDGGTRTPTPPNNISSASIQSTMTHSIDTALSVSTQSIGINTLKSKPQKLHHLTSQTTESNYSTDASL